MVSLMQTDVFGMVIWFFMFFIFLFLYPRLMLSQLIYKIEQSARKMENMSESANRMTSKKIGGNTKDIKKKVDEFTEFFVVEPSNIDPYGLVKKIDQTIRSMEDRFDDFVDEIAPDKPVQEKQEINYALRAAIGLKQISKLVRHFVEMAKKFKNLQIAMILQMQLPLIEKIAEGEHNGTEAFIKGWPIGDSIGPLIAATYIDKEGKISEDVVMGKTDIAGRKCFVLKATGPSPHLGRIDEAINAIMRKHRIVRVVTIDAAQKLEGEKSGAVAEGVGFAMGGIGQREMIENVLLPKKIPLDSVVVKVGMTEAIMPMKKDIYNSVQNAKALVEKSVKRAKKGENVIVIGIGNSSGIGDNKREIEKVKNVVEELDRKYKLGKERRKSKWI